MELTAQKIAIALQHSDSVIAEAESLGCNCDIVVEVKFHSRRNACFGAWLRRHIGNADPISIVSEHSDDCALALRINANNN